MYPLVMTTIAFEDGPFIVDLSMKECDFPWFCKRSPEGMGVSQMG